MSLYYCMMIAERKLTGSNAYPLKNGFQNPLAELAVATSTSESLADRYFLKIGGSDRSRILESILQWVEEIVAKKQNIKRN